MPTGHSKSLQQMVPSLESAEHNTHSVSSSGNGRHRHLAVSSSGNGRHGHLAVAEKNTELNDQGQQSYQGRHPEGHASEVT